MFLTPSINVSFMQIEQSFWCFPFIFIALFLLSCVAIQVKAAFTRKFNQVSHMNPYSVDAGKKKKGKGGGGGVPEVDSEGGLLGEEGEEAAATQEEEEGSDDDVSSLQVWILLNPLKILKGRFSSGLEGASVIK